MKTVRLSEEYQVRCFKENSHRFKALEIKFNKGVKDKGWIGVGEEYELLLRLAYKDLNKIVYIGNIKDYKEDLKSTCENYEWIIIEKI